MTAEPTLAGRRSAAQSGAAAGAPLRSWHRPFGVLLAGCLIVGAGLVVAFGFNVMGDEWVCSDGEAPAGAHGLYDNCYAGGSTLPAGVTWDPFGNRPMPYNCKKDGWAAIERTVTHRGVPNVEKDCVREGTDLPSRWHIAESE